MRVHKINNVNKALDFIASKGVKLVSIGAEGERAHKQNRSNNTTHSFIPHDLQMKTRLEVLIQLCPSELNPEVW